MRDIINKLVVQGNDYMNVIHYISNYNQVFDFNTIIKIPDELKIVDSSTVAIAWYFKYNEPREYPEYQVQKWKKLFDGISEEDKQDLYGIADKYHSNYIKYGFTTWKDWANYNWGTPYNSENVNNPNFISSENRIYFKTAHEVYNLIKELSLLFPYNEFYYESYVNDIDDITKYFIKCGIVYKEI